MSASPICLVKRYLCVKKLTVNDGFTNKSIKLLRAEARFFMGELRNRQAIPLVLLDEGGSCWELICTCIGAQYSLSRIGAFCEAHGARPGCYFIFYADHDHLVRLAVRQELPEDVQAALAAARAAAMAVRSDPLRVELQSQQQQTHRQTAIVSNSSASLPANPGSVPVIDDPVALDEMPIEATCNMSENLPVAAAPAPTKQLTRSESPRPMPLQDRSNLPSAVPVPDAAGTAAKPKQVRVRLGHSTGVTGTAAMTRSVLGDKENDASSAFRVASAENPKPSVSTFPVVSTGGLQAPVLGANRVPWQQQAPVPQPVLPPPVSRLQPALPAPSPATRLRLRFEARLRAQAGKLHPLSVRTGPESPLPSPPGYCSTGTWPAALPGVYPLLGPPGLTGSQGNSLFPVPWGLNCAWGPYPAQGFRPDSRAVDAYPQHDPTLLCSASVAPRTAAICPHRAFNDLAPSRQQGCGVAAAATLPTKQEYQRSYETWSQDLRCNELLEWEVGRRAAANVDVGMNGCLAFPPPMQHSWPWYPVQMQLPPLQPPCLPCDSQPAAEPLQSAKVNMGLLRQWLLMQGRQPLTVRQSGIPPCTRQGLVDSGTKGQQQQPGINSEAPQQHGTRQSPKRLGFSTSSESALQKLFSMSAAWDFAAMSGVAAHLCQPAEALPHSTQQTSQMTPSHIPTVQVDILLPQRTALMGGPTCPSSHNIQPLHTFGEAMDACMDVDCFTGWGREQEAGDRISYRPRRKSRFSTEREHAQDEHESPARSASCKRQRSVSQQLMACKLLTAHDLLSDRVALSMVPAASSVLIGLFRKGVGTTAVSGMQGGSTTFSTNVTPPEPDRQQERHRLGLSGCPASVSVDVLVESGASYEGKLYLCGPHGGAPVCEWALHGLRPYLIRRQAGVGDVLTLSIDDTDQQAGGILRLVAQLQQFKAV